MFTITYPAGNSNSVLDSAISESMAAIKICLNITFEKNIKQLITNNDFVRQEGKKQISIETSFDELENGTEEKKCVMMLSK